MTNFDESFVYESLLEHLKATHDIRKKRYEERKHLLSDEDRAIERTLFTLEDDAIIRSEKIDHKDVLFCFDNLVNSITGSVESFEQIDSPQDPESSTSNMKEKRLYFCTVPDCQNVYTSFHGLKYHLDHGHTKDKENIYKPFVCTIPGCRKTYRNSNGLKYHMNKIHFQKK